MAKCILETCFKLAIELGVRECARFIPMLSDDIENNYNVFWRFAGVCPSTVLAVLFRLGHFASHPRLLIAAGEMISARRDFFAEEEEELADVGGHIGFLLRQYENVREGNGKFLFLFKLAWLKNRG